MRCPYCGSTENRVTDSRSAEDDNAIRRRRECLDCGKRFTTWERTEFVPLTVIKKDGMREPFDRSKLLSGLMKACYKRPISVEVLKDKTSEIEWELIRSGETEIPARTIGERCMSVLEELDQIAYVRFASVYREFKDAESFMNELRKIMDSSAKSE